MPLTVFVQPQQDNENTVCPAAPPDPPQLVPSSRETQKKHGNKMCVAYSGGQLYICSNFKIPIMLPITIQWSLC